MVLEFRFACAKLFFVTHRTIEIVWLPGSKKSWTTFSSARIEAARLWNDLVVRHHRIRRLQWTWPAKRRWEVWAKTRYPNLHSQTIQQVIEEFLEAVRSVSSLRKKGHPEARYPWRKERYRDVPYTNQGARVRNGYLLLPNGKAGTLAVKVPKGVTLPGRLMEARLEYGRVLLVCQLEEERRPAGGEVVVGVDLGVNTLACATDGETAIAVSGRGVKAAVQYRNKKLAELVSKQGAKKKGSRRHKRLQRRKYALLAKTSRKIRDACHKATRKIVEAFPRARIVVGKPFNEAAQRVGRVQAQQVSQACTRKLIGMLDYKARGAIVVPEPYSSQTCPVCGCRQKSRRTYRCGSCGFEAPRDVVGAWNIRQIGMGGGMAPTPAMVAPKVIFVHPSKYPGGSQVVPAEPRQVAQGPQGL